MRNWRERALSWRTNVSRLRHGKRPLRADLELDRWARGHSDNMATQRLLYHGDLAWTMGRARWAQNVGVGASVLEVHRAFLRSPEHRANLLGPYRVAGFGVVRDDRGALWVTVNFGG